MKKMTSKSGKFRRALHEHRALVGWLIFIVLTLVLELTLFNLPSWQTAGLTPQNIATQEQFVEGEGQTFELDSPLSIQTLRVSTNKSCQVTIGFLDEGSTVYPTSFKHDIYLGESSTQYIELHAYGDVSMIQMSLDELLDPSQALAVPEGESAEISATIIANVPIPFNFSLLRIAVILGVGALVWAFLPRRRIWRMPVFTQATKEATEDNPDDAFPAMASESTPSPAITEPLPATHPDTFTQTLMHKTAKRAIALVTATLCVLSLSQLAILPQLLGEFGKGYSTISAHNYYIEVRDSQLNATEDRVSSETASTTTTTQTDASENDDSAASESGAVRSGLADKSSQISASSYADTSPLAYLYPSTYESEYGKFARALAAGQLHLLDNPHPSLVALENPYDPGMRTEVASDESGYYWDTAFYKGKFYVYFGVLPALVFYLPYFLLTGQDLPNFVPIAVCLIALIIGISMLLAQIARRWLPRVSLGAFLLSLILAVLGAQLGWLTLLPQIYEVPVSMALALLVWSGVCFVSLDRHPRLVFAGSLMVALIFACRPQIGLFGLLLIPFGIQALMARQTMRSRMAYLAAALIPIIVVFAGIGVYNALRFGNPFDFGAAYNLTTNDMRYRPATLDMALMSLFSYLFQLPVLEPFFPFLDPVMSSSGSEGREVLQDMWGYAGNIITEAPIGGLLWLSPLVWFVIALFTAKAACPGRGLKAFAVATTVLTLVVVIIDGEGAGILPRYVLDFALPILVLGAFGFMLLDTRRELAAPPARWLVVLGMAMLLIGLIVTVGVAFHENTIRVSWIYDMAQLHATVNHLLFG